jgi:hypothetical protein
MMKHEFQISPHRRALLAALCVTFTVLNPIRTLAATPAAPQVMLGPMGFVGSEMGRVCVSLSAPAGSSVTIQANVAGLRLDPCMAIGSAQPTNIIGVLVA